MAKNAFLNVNEVAEELSVSKSYAYKLIRKLNNELKSMGYLTIAGRINRKFFMKKMCYDNSNMTERKR